MTGSLSASSARRLTRGFMILASLLAAAPVWGQVTTAEASGRVSSDGTAAANARVTALHLATGFQRSSVTDQQGHYRLTALQPGAYEISVQLQGFSNLVRRGVDLEVGQVATLDFELAPAELAVAIEVVVEARAPLIELTQSARSFRIDSDEIEGLPLKSRDVLELALLAPGVTADRSGADPSFSPLNFGAQNDRGTLVLVDGMDHSNSLFGGLVGFNPGLLPQNAVEQFELHSGRYNAGEGGTAAGVINLVTKAGGNEVAGSVFGFFRDDALNATNHFDRSKPPFGRQQFGAHVGGPIVANRAHFFAAVERNQEDANAVVNTGGVFPAIEGTFPQPTRATRILGRIDHQLSPSQWLNGQVLHMDSYTEFLFGGRVAQSGGVSSDEGTTSVSLEHRWAVNDTVMNQLRIGYLSWRVDGRPLSFEPRLVFPSAEAGRFPLSPVDFSVRRFQLRQDLSSTSTNIGWHRWGFGGNFEHETMSKAEELFASGLFIIPIDVPIPPVVGLVGEGDSDFGSISNSLIGLYAQDDWGVSGNLTLNLGVRYDVETNATNQDFVSTKNDPDLPYVSDGTRRPDTNNLAPRIGFAWQPSDDYRTVIRGGYGLYYGRIVQDLPFGERASDQWRTYTIFFPGTIDVGEIDLTGRPYRVDFLLPEEVKTPLNHQFSIGLAREVGDDISVEADYYGTRGHNEIWSGVDVNPIDPATFMRPAPQFQEVIVARTDGRSRYDALSLVVRKRPSHNYDFRVAYTLARVRNDFDDPIFASVFGPGPAAWDERHVFVASGRVLMPYEVQASGILYLASGRPYGIYTGTDDNLNGDLTDDLPPGVGRNSERADGVATLDLRVAKMFEARRTRIELIFDVFNLFNRANFDSTSYNGNQASPNFGQPSVALAPRQVQLGFRVSF